jgi:hypothetical protein
MDTEGGWRREGDDTGKKCTGSNAGKISMERRKRACRMKDERGREKEKA